MYPGVQDLENVDGVQCQLRRGVPDHGGSMYSDRNTVFSVHFRVNEDRSTND